MFKFVVAGLCGISLTGIVYMAGWGAKPPMDGTCDDCGAEQVVAVSKDVGFKVPAGKTDMKNTKCIVEIEDVGDSKDFVTYKDEVYHICCTSCVADFNKDPEKYVKAFVADPAKFGVKK